MPTNNIKILAIETSCDETAAAVIFGRCQKTKELKTEGTKEQLGPIIYSNIVSSQVDLHALTGGVVPEVASRAHMEAILPVIEEALKQAVSEVGGQRPDEKVKANENWKLRIDNSSLLDGITHVAVTAGPGLIGSLLVGFNTAKAIAYGRNLPIIPINHIEGHIYSAFSGEITNHKSQTPDKFQNQNIKLEKNNLAIQQPVATRKSSRGGFNNEPEFPVLALTVSGGHTSLTLMRGHGKYQTIGQTRDDAAGEAFDKVAKLLGLGYPGGPAVSKLAEEYRRTNLKSKCQMSSVSARPSLDGNKIQSPKSKEPDKANRSSDTIILPRPMINDESFDFSFSGLKTAVLEVVKDLRTEELKNKKAEICAAFEDAVVDVLVTKTLRAAEKYQPKSVILAGGVAANKHLREELTRCLSNQKSEIRNPNKPKKLNPNSCQLLIPPIELCGDNAAMIGMAAYYHIARGDESSWDKIKVDSNLEL